MPPSSEPPGNQHVGHLDLTVWRTRAGRLLVVLAHWLAVRLGPHAALVATLAVAGLAVTALTMVSAEIYESVSDADGAAGLDRPVLEAALSLRNDPLNDAVTAFTDLGGKVGMPLLATGAVLAMTVAWRQWTPVVLMVAATIGSVTMTVVGKAAVGRSRPPLLEAVPPYESSAAFPSGHALNSIVIAGLIAYLLVRHQRTAWVRAATMVAAALFAVAMGLSRVYLGHHWLTDVLMAWTLGLAWLTMVIVAHRLFLTVSRSRHSEGPRT
ncbi:phosphatase PAP2 family protein [Blastococcus sp. SYSU DS1024]